MADHPKIPPNPLIETERLILHPLTHEHADLICSLRTDPDVVYWRKPDTRDIALEWLEARIADPKSFNYVVALKEDPSQYIGSLGSAQLPEIGYMYSKSVWGKGYATEALSGWIDTYWKRFPDGCSLLEEKHREALWAVTGPEDAKSPRVLQKCGFIKSGQVEVEEDGKMVMLDQWRSDKPGTR